jgi:ATP-dependent protease ClpP protease subunit
MTPKAQPRQWYRFDNSTADPSVAEIHIIDWIGDWVDDAMNRIFGENIGLTARAFAEELSKLPASVSTIRVHINSPGGDVQGGINIANALREQGSKGRTVETIVDGIAASIASVIAMAGTKVIMADNALMMVHNPWSIAIGNADDMRKTAEVLDTVRGQVIATYQWHSQLAPEALASLMDAETWMNADEAIANGLATEKIDGLKAAASIDPRTVANLKIPEKYKARVQALVQPADPRESPAPKAAVATEVLRLCREGACLDIAEALIGENLTLEQVQARITTAKEDRTKAEARASQITTLCATSKVPELAAGYIAGGMTVADVKAHLVTITAKLDAAEIDGGLGPAKGTKTGKVRATANPNAMSVTH